MPEQITLKADWKLLLVMAVPLVPSLILSIVVLVLASDIRDMKEMVQECCGNAKGGRAEAVGVGNSVEVHGGFESLVREQLEYQRRQKETK